MGRWYSMSPVGATANPRRGSLGLRYFFIASQCSGWNGCPGFNSTLFSGLGCASSPIRIVPLRAPFDGPDDLESLPSRCSNVCQTGSRVGHTS